MSVVENPSDHVRLFVAITVPDFVKAAIKTAQDELRRILSDGGVRWTKPNQLHLTLRFLGNVPTDSLPSLTDSLHPVCQSFGALELCARGIGFFPSAGRPRVVWAGIQDSASGLSLLQRAVQDATLEFTEEKPEERFRGHVTLGRIKELARREIDALRIAAGRLSETSFGEWTATEIHLMRSRLSPQGAEHVLLAAVPLVQQKPS